MSGIAVHIRVKPSQGNSAWCTAETILYPAGKPDNRFVFNKVHSPSASNANLFQSVEPLIHAAFDGRNVTVMAYGQTGSGKTHTMVGTPGDQGIIPRTALKLVELANSHKNCTLEASCVEIYNEGIKDLLARKGDPREGREIEVRDMEGAVVFDREMSTIRTYAEFCVMWSRAESARKTGVTDLNDHSSRSHLMLMFTVRRPGKAPSTMYLVDLAGSESAARANTEGAQLREGGFINKSLLALGNVVDAIVEGRPHVNYRDSKLTRILRNCLGGAGLTFLVAAVNPVPESYEQTCCVLRFAQRAMKMKTDPIVTVPMVPFYIFNTGDVWNRWLHTHVDACNKAFEQELAVTFHRVKAQIGERGLRLNEAVQKFKQWCDALTVAILAREQLLRLRRQEENQSHAEELSGKEVDAQQAKEQAVRRFNEANQTLGQLKSLCEHRRNFLSQLQAQAVSFEARSLSERTERQLALSSPLDVFQEQEELARLSLKREQAMLRRTITHDFVTPVAEAFGGDTGSLETRQEAMRRFHAQIEKERREVQELEQAYEMIYGEAESTSMGAGPEEHDSLVEQGVDRSTTHGPDSGDGLNLSGFDKENANPNGVPCGPGFFNGEPVELETDDLLENEAFNRRVEDLTNARQTLVDTLKYRERKTIMSSPMPSSILIPSTILPKPHSSIASQGQPQKSYSHSHSQSHEPSHVGTKRSRSKATAQPPTASAGGQSVQFQPEPEESPATRKRRIQEQRLESLAKARAVKASRSKSRSKSKSHSITPQKVPLQLGYGGATFNFTPLKETSVPLVADPTPSVERELHFVSSPIPKGRRITKA